MRDLAARISRLFRSSGPFLGARVRGFSYTRIIHPRRRLVKGCCEKLAKIPVYACTAQVTRSPLEARLPAPSLCSMEVVQGLDNAVIGVESEKLGAQSRILQQHRKLAARRAQGNRAYEGMGERYSDEHAAYPAE